jgi:hypothetical protein
MVVWIQEGRMKVFSPLAQVFQEYRSYHRKDGKIVALRDDTMSAWRYAFMSRRWGVAGADDMWTDNKELKYPEYGII